MTERSSNSMTFSKIFLQKINFLLSNHNNKKTTNIWHSIYKWNYDHNLLKNILKLTNKILKGLNKYHVFKKDYVYLFIGMGLGHLANQIENNWDKIQNMNLQPPIADVLITQVLKNQMIRLKLQQAVNDNVLQNEDIQTNLHFVLINKVLNPQRQNINKLVKQGIISVLQSQQIFNLAQIQVVKVIQKSEPLIAKQALKFLNSQQMDKIITTFVPPLLSGQMVQTFVSTELIKLVTSQLNNQENQQRVYNFLRQKII